jgi:hypothetical protein
VKVANEPWVDFEAFEEAFKTAIKIHCRKPPPDRASMTFLEWYIATVYRQPPVQPCSAHYFSQGSRNSAKEGPTMNVILTGSPMLPFGPDSFIDVGPSSASRDSR